MRGSLLLSVVFGLLIASAQSKAADLGIPMTHRDAVAIRFCPAGQQSAIATLQSLEAMQVQTRELYATSVEIYERDSTHNSRAMQIKWADLARITCGIAAGHLASGEVNIDRLSQCECNFVRMTRFR
jgi:hypothetical protein